MKKVYRHYRRTRQPEMADLMAHEIKRHQRIRRKLNHEREMGDETEE